MPPFIFLGTHPSGPAPYRLQPLRSRPLKLGAGGAGYSLRCSREWRGCQHSGVAGSPASPHAFLRSTIWPRTVVHLHQRAGSLSLSSSSPSLTTGRSASSSCGCHARAPEASSAMGAGVDAVCCGAGLSVLAGTSGAPVQRQSNTHRKAAGCQCHSVARRRGRGDVTLPPS